MSFHVIPQFLEGGDARQGEMRNVMEISSYALESLRHDDEFILNRRNPWQSDAPFVLLLMPALSRPTLESLKKLEHDCSLRNQLDATWAVRPLELFQYNDQRVLVLEDRVQ